MNYPRCATCMHFSAQARWDGSRTCENPQISEDYGAFDESRPRMMYPYTEGAGMYPSPDFGCVLHEPAYVVIHSMDPLRDPTG